MRFLLSCPSSSWEERAVDFLDPFEFEALLKSALPFLYRGSRSHYELLDNLNIDFFLILIWN